MVDTGVGITETTTSLADMDLRVMVKVLQFATRLERFISLYSPKINFFHGGENSCMRSRFIASCVGGLFTSHILLLVIRIQRWVVKYVINFKKFVAGCGKVFS